jgi:predicted lipoprotein with Yx(FWY)xxD motif
MKRLLILGVTVALVAAAVAIAVLARRGGGDDSAAPARPATNATTVSVQEIGNEGAVLVDSEGRALYAADQEIAAGNMVLCTHGCTSFWVPLTLDSGAPTGNAVSGGLGVAERPNGARQVTLDGKLLYTFAEDEPAEVTGDGFEDAFDGQKLTWHVVHPDGSTGSSRSDKATPGPFGY